MGAARRIGFLDSLVDRELVGLDTPVFIYYLNRQEPYFQTCLEILKRVEFGRLRAVISVVSEMEILALSEVPDRLQFTNDAHQLLERLEHLQILDVDRIIARRAAEVRARARIKGLDALIAATALTQGCRYVIGNDAELATRVKDILYITLDEIIESEEPTP